METDGNAAITLESLYSKLALIDREFEAVNLPSR